MAKLELGDWRQDIKSNNVLYARGAVTVNKLHEIPVTAWSSSQHIEDETLPKLVAHTGLGSGREVMTTTARMAAEMGSVAVTYNNTGLSIHNPLSLMRTSSWANPLSRNADDGLFVTESLPPGELTEHGLSMGGAVATKVASRADRDIRWLTVVSPAGYTHGVRDLSAFQVAKAFSREIIDEAYDGSLHPGMAFHIACGGIRNSLARPFAIPFELRQLLQDTVYEDLRAFKENQPDANVLLAYGSRDKLIHPTELKLSIATEEAGDSGSLFTVLLPYDGHHGRTGYDADLIRQILSIEHPSDNLPDAA